MREDVTHQDGAVTFVRVQRVGCDDPGDPAHQAALRIAYSNGSSAAASSSMNSRNQNSSMSNDQRR